MHPERVCSAHWAVADVEPAAGQQAKLGAPAVPRGVKRQGLTTHCLLLSRGVQVVASVLDVHLPHGASVAAGSIELV